MAERKYNKPEIASQKKRIKLAPAIGDWTTYNPPKVLVKQVKSGLYGFDRLSKKELNQALNIHYRFIQDLLKKFRIDLGLSVELFSVQIEQTTYLNFLRSLAGPIIQGQIKLPNLHEHITLLLDLPVANSIINYGLGSIDLEAINRALTDGERTTLETILANYLNDLSQAFAGTIKDLSLTLSSSPEVIIDPTIIPASTFMIFCAEVALADNPPGKIFIAYQNNFLKSLLENYRWQDQHREPDFTRLPAAILAKIKVPLLTVLGETTLTTNEISSLESGDIIALEAPLENGALTMVGDLIKIITEPGTKVNKSAIRVVNVQEKTAVRPAKPLSIPAKELIAPPVVQPLVTPPPAPPAPAPPLPEKPPLPRPAAKPLTAPPKPAPAPKPPKPDPFEEDDFLDDDFLDDDFTEDDFNKESK
ncbi:hypothetical protein COT42_05520 [Candidatus Saganbacteria bacterium CG08_land_8_20_14_0_20_45_16]|uniref:Flagellar motor switch protein FliM n=1 Tax=Candidatus Saganbacteria bacterium CG08_land_8_20_14_0_20_45_16 TaxID=2014293 RepID=A0A2H0XZ57_UNCSA|nr:MAG: hypothetical protein COT42_05520 [Candidatus Saganbacteria bacterium CG08_land_8_20_14_0_20_45_16]